ncbi:MAG: segregation/condensation protein A [Candidatus Limnocylindrales bacterium]|jgi:segregation and condensation protein A
MRPMASEGGPSGLSGRIGVMPRPGAAPEVDFDAARVESVTHVRLEAFDGPLALLLAVIEARQLDVLTVPLGGLAEAYLDALATLEGDRLGNVSAFVAVAAQLILIKSRAILPRPPKMAAVPLDDEPDPEAELRARLLEYRRFRDAGLALGERIGVYRFFRRDAEVAAIAGRAGARPPQRPPLPPSVLERALSRLATVVPVPPPPPEVVGRTITLAERAAVIRAALRGSDTIVLQELLGGVRDRVVVAVTFLALLELSKRREITLEQAEPWGPIVARRLAETADSESEIDESLESFA